jgi:DNA polymerase (family 10)
MENARIAEVFDKIADLLELKGDNPFRVRSYRTAALTVKDHSERLEDMVRQGKDLTKIPHVGEAISKKIQEIVARGTCKRLEELEQEVPAGLLELLRVPQLGPRKVALLYDKLSISSLEDLKKAAQEHKIRDLPGMGSKTEENILKGIETVEAGVGRYLLSAAYEHAASIGRHLNAIKTIERWEVAGSFRRQRETIGDLDILVEAKDREKATDAIVSYEAIEEVLGKGHEKISVRLHNGLQIDFRFFEPDSFGSALAYFTGSKAHNVALRKRAQQKDWKLNEYGLFEGEHQIAGQTEESLYKCFDLPWIPPELREDRGELEAAEQGRLPKLVDLEQIRGDLHVHTTASDGINTLEEMVEAARNLKYQYLGVTEHSKAVTVAHGLDEDAVLRRVQEIRELNASLKDFWVLAGLEVDILKNGALDIDEKVLAELDWVVASVHSNFNLDEKAMTDRLLVAIRSGVVHCLGHPLTRLIGARDSIRFEMERILRACAENNVWIEINAQPDRLDLPDIHCQHGKELGARFAIGTDAHRHADLNFMKFGVAVARRGWLEKTDVLNTCTIEQLKQKLRKP